MSDTHENADGEWLYDCYIVGRTTRTVEVHGADGPHTIEKGTIRFEPRNTEDLAFVRAENGWTSHFMAPEPRGSDRDDPARAGVHLSHDLLGVVEFPEPMTDAEACAWLDDNPEEWRQFVDETLESDVRAADLLEEVR